MSNLNERKQNYNRSKRTNRHAHQKRENLNSWISRQTKKKRCSLPFFFSKLFLLNELISFFWLYCSPILTRGGTRRRRSRSATPAGWRRARPRWFLRRSGPRWTTPVRWRRPPPGRASPRSSRRASSSSSKPKMKNRIIEKYLQTHQVSTPM
jgi:hypothetical protein